MGVLVVGEVALYTGLVALFVFPIHLHWSTSENRNRLNFTQ